MLFVCQYLFDEGVLVELIVVVGNIVVDVIVCVCVDWLSVLLVDLLLLWYGVEQQYIFVMCYWCENFGDVFDSICCVLWDLCVCYVDYCWVFLVYLNLVV